MIQLTLQPENELKSYLLIIGVTNILNGEIAQESGEIYSKRLLNLYHIIRKTKGIAEGPGETYSRWLINLYYIIDKIEHVEGFGPWATNRTLVREEVVGGYSGSRGA